MYILIEPEQFPDDLHAVARLGARVCADVTGLPLGEDGGIDGSVDEGDARRIVAVVENVLDLVHWDGSLPAGLVEFLRALQLDG